MEVRRRAINAVRSSSVGKQLKTQKQKQKQNHVTASNSDSQALPLVPLYLTNGVFFGLFFSVAYFLLHRWREKIRTSTPLHVVTLSEMAAIVSLIASVIYLFGFFGIGIIHPIISRSSSSDGFEMEEEDDIVKDDARIPGPCPAAAAGTLWHRAAFSLRRGRRNGSVSGVRVGSVVLAGVSDWGLPESGGDSARGGAEYDR